jgi:hypothetical protein
MTVRPAHFPASVDLPRKAATYFPAPLLSIKTSRRTADSAPPPALTGEIVVPVAAQWAAAMFIILIHAASTF